MSAGVQPVLDAIARTAARLCEARDAQIFLVEGTTFRRVARYGHFRSMFDAGRHIDLTRGLVAGRAVLDRKTVHVRDPARAIRSDFAEARGYLTTSGTRTVLAAPLLRNGAALGAILIRRRRVRPFTAKQIALLKTFADQAAIAIENARLSAELRDRNRTVTDALEQQTATSDILRVMSSSLTNVQPVFDTILANALRLCEAHNGAIFTFDGQVFRLVAAAGVSTEFLSHLREAVILPGRETPLRRLGLEPHVSHVADILADSSFSPPEAYRREGMRTLLAVPMLKEGRLIGALTFHRRIVRPFTDKQVALLKTFADQAVIAIENARLFKELEARNRDLTEALERQTATSEILRVISQSPTDLEPVLQAVARTAARLCDAVDAAITRVDGGRLRPAAHYGPIPLEQAFLDHGMPLTAESVGGRAVLEARRIHVDDLMSAEGAANFPVGSGYARRLDYHTTMAVPLIRQGTAIGTITVRRREVRPFTEGQMALLETFADQAVIAIENVRLFRELESSNTGLRTALEQQTATGEVLRTISQSPTDVQPVFEGIVQSATRLCDAAWGAAFRFDGQLQTVVAHHGTTPSELDVLRRVYPAAATRERATGRAIVDRRVVHVADLQADAEYAAAPLRDVGLRTVLAVPVLRDGEPIGALGLWRRDVRPFTDKQIELVATFADQAVIAVENVRLFKELESRNRDLTQALEQQTATGEILKVISTSPTDVQPVFAAVAASAAGLCDAFDGAIHLVEGDALRLVAHHGPIPPDTVLPLRDTVGGRTIHGRRVMHVADLQTEDAEYPQSAAFARQGGFRTILSVPLLRGSEAIGTITIRRTEVRSFTERQVELLNTFADQAVIAIENVRLFKELEARNRDLTTALEQQTATSEILRVISQSPTDAQPVFETIARNAVRLCGAINGGVYLFDGELVHAVANEGYTPEQLAHWRGTFPRPLSHGGVSSRAIRTRAVVRIDDVESTPGFEVPDEIIANLRARGARSVLAVPMLRRADVIGAIAISHGSVAAFSDTRVELLKTFADQAVIAIENVRLFTELEARNRELRVALDQQTATADILHVISRSPTDVQPVFQAIVDSAARLLRGNSGVLSRIVGDQIELAAFTRTDDVGDALLASMFPIALRSSGSEIRPIRDRVIGERIPYNVADVETDPRVGERGRANARARGYRSQLVVPMLRHDEPLGTIAVTRSEPGAFSDEEIALLTTFADQAVIAIENVRLFKELEERNRDLTESLEQQTATSEILRVISSSPTQIQPVLDALAESAARLCRSVDCNLFLLDGDRLALRARHHGPPGGEVVGEFAIPIVRGTVGGRTVLDRRAVHVVDLLAEADQFPQAQDNARRFGFRTMLSVPLMREGAALGVIQLRRTEVNPFTDRQVELLKTFADQAVIAIENVRLFNELEERNRDLTEALEQQTATSEILRAISSSPTDVQPVFATVAASAARLCDAFDAAIHRVDGDALRLVAHEGPIPPDAVLPLTQGTLAGCVIRERRAMHVADMQAEADVYPVSSEFARRRGFRTILGVPLLRGAEAIGTITIRRTEVRPFTDRQAELLRTFADQAVIAIENVRLFKELEARTAQLTRSVDELTALGEVSRALSSTLDLETILTTIATRASELAGTDAVSVYEYDEAAQTFHWRATANLDEEVAAVARRTPIPRGVGVQGRMAVTHAPVQISDITTADAYQGPLRDVLLRTGTRAVLAVPLLRDDRLVGGLTVNKKTPGEFSPETVEVLKTFATQSALAINNARLFREIEDKGRQLETASRHKSQFLANMSHELRTPLNAILGYTELIADNIYGDVPERMREVLERVDKSGRHLLGLINDILDLSKIEAGQLTLALTPYSMDGVAQTVATAVGALAAEKQLGFEVVLAEDLPIGQGDERRLTQVLLNLVGNAIKFTDVGKVVMRVGTSGDAYVVSVTDTGPGIAEADREKIFEEFQQADTTRAKAKGGTGLGLAISRRIVEMHGGRLWAESTLGEGSTFSFTVPIRVEQQVVPPARRAAS